MKLNPTIGPKVPEKNLFVREKGNIIVYLVECLPLYSSAGKNLAGFWNQTPSLSLTQNVTAYQFLGP